MGTVVNNPILIVDQAKRLLEKGGVTPHEAVHEAVALRFRPIAMSTWYGTLPGRRCHRAVRDPGRSSGFADDAPGAHGDGARVAQISSITDTTSAAA
jgi:hypothetical protein